MNNNTKIIAAGTAAMAISFFLPWINIWVGGIAPSNMLKAGADAMTLGTLIFIASFVLAAVVCVMSVTGKENPKLAVAAGALPFAMAAWAILKSTAAVNSSGYGGSIPWGDLGQLFQIVAIGLPIYAIGAAATLVGGFRELNAAAPTTEVSAAPNPASVSTDEPT